MPDCNIEIYYFINYIADFYVNCVKLLVFQKKNFTTISDSRLLVLLHFEVMNDSRGIARKKVPNLEMKF